MDKKGFFLGSGISKRTLFSLVLLVSGFMLGLLSTIVAVKIYEDKSQEGGDYFELRTGGYAEGLTNPLLDCSMTKENIIDNLSPFQSKIENEIKEGIKRGDVTHVSYYFRELDNGVWFAINEKEKFTPASLLKVPVMMTLYDQASSEPGFLEKQIPYLKNGDFYQNIPIKKEMVEGQLYSISDLIAQMIVHSDNNALFSLTKILDQQSLFSLMRKVGIQQAGMSEEELVDVVQYSSFFRILYNSSYLGRTYSEKALSLMTQIDYREGLPKGLPKDILISHKFGERNLGDSMQLHDCGIVYVKKHNYLICVMTRGSDLNKMNQTISHLSAVTYNNVQSQVE